jgi:hypothetical protein
VHTPEANKSPIFNFISRFLKQNNIRCCSCMFALCNWNASY